MIRAAIAFVVLALTAFLLGLTGLADFSLQIFRILLIAMAFFAIVGVGVGMIGGDRASKGSM